MTMLFKNFTEYAFCICNAKCFRKCFKLTFIMNLTSQYIQLTFTCSKLIIETVEKGVKYVQSQQ